MRRKYTKEFFRKNPELVEILSSGSTLEVMARRMKCSITVAHYMRKMAGFPGRYRHTSVNNESYIYSGKTFHYLNWVRDLIKKYGETDRELMAGAKIEAGNIHKYWVDRNTVFGLSRGKYIGGKYGR
jgi:predicted nucleotidyltransferase